jgi:serine/threonine protein kinase
MCPEIVLGMQYDFKADVWALGSLTFELFIGSPIMSFYEPRTQALDLKLIDGLLYLPQLDRISLECIDFLSACLQFDPANRFDMNDLINHPFLTVPTNE